MLSSNKLTSIKTTYLIKVRRNKYDARLLDFKRGILVFMFLYCPTISVDKNT